MKRSIIIAAAVLFAWGVARAGNTYSDDPRFTDAKLQAIEKSLQQALESGNFGMQTSAAQVTRDIKALVPQYEFAGLVIPLMRIVKDEDAKPASRVIAALALNELHSDRGYFAIRRVAELTDVKQVKHVCEWLTYYRALAAKQHEEAEPSIAGNTR